jgi:hypothetical protein
MDFLDDPDEMPPSERFSEIAAILAAGYLGVPGHRDHRFQPIVITCSGGS